jgi:cellulose biosynthesis protein BcsQ
MLGILATYNVKGGVGKTTTTANLAWLAARDGFRTLLWDLDPQGGATFCLDVLPGGRIGSRKLVTGRVGLDEAVRPSAFANLHVLPAHRSFRNMDLHLEQQKHPGKRLLKMMRPLSRQYDLLMIDCAPSISLVSENVFRAADALLIPVVPNPLSLRAVEQVRAFLDRQRLNGVELLPFFSMVDQRKRLHRELVERPPGDVAVFADAWIPYASEVEQMTVRRAPLVSYAPGSRAGLAFRRLWEETRSRLGWRGGLHRVSVA